MNETTAATGLTATDIKALRDADSVSFHQGASIKGSISCAKRVKDAGPWDEREKRYDIYVDSRACGSGVSYERRESVSCFTMIFSSKHSEEWQSIVGILRKGDILSLCWSANGMRNGYLERARVTETGEDGSSAGMGMGLNADALYLEVKRGEKKLRYLICVSICPDNSARMIRV